MSNKRVEPRIIEKKRKFKMSKIRLDQGLLKKKKKENL